MDAVDVSRPKVALNHDHIASASAGAEAYAMMRASFDAQLDPQLLIEAVRDDAGRIVDFTYRDVNRATCETLGATRARLIGRGLCDTLPEFEESGLLGRYADCVELGTPVLLDDYTYTNTLLGETRQCDIRAARADRDLLTVTWRDVTERFNRVQRIAASEAQFRLLAKNIGEVVSRIGDDGTILWISESVEQALGVPAEDLIGAPLSDFVGPEDLASARRQAATVGEAFVGRARVLPDDAPHWIHFFLKPFYDAEGTRDGMVVTFRVIDEEVDIECQVDESRRLQAEADARWHRMMDNAAVGMCLADLTGRFDVVNHAMCEFFGYDEDTLRQMTWQELTAPEFLETDVAAVEALVAGRLDSYRTAKQFIHADGHLVWGDVSVSCLRRADGDVESLVAQITDITKEVEARQNLTHRDEQNRILATRLQEKSDLLTAELQSAAAYVASILPGNLDGPVRVSSRYLPSQALAGDCYDYRWVDDDHLIVYLLDVSGHGIESALLSVSIHNLLRSGSISDGVLLQPDHVLGELNELFAMEEHAGNYFTMWFGVYEQSTRTLTYASGGHPPALLLDGTRDAVSVTLLSTEGMPVGMFSGSEYSCAAVSVTLGDTLLLYSDGAYEIPLPGGETRSLTDFTTLCGRLAATPDWTLDTLIANLRGRTMGGAFDDDVSMVLLNFVA